VKLKDGGHEPEAQTNYTRLVGIHDRKKIPTVIPMFAGSGSTTSLNTSTHDQTNHVVLCGLFLVLAYKITRPPLNRPRRRCIGDI